MANHRFGPRTNARSQALQLLFQAEINGRTVDEVLAGDYALSDGPLDEFGERLARGVASERLTLDAIIDMTAENWKISRMPIVDRNLLRLALYEILSVPEVATAVAIDEYVELAKAYGADDSRKFINGLLGKVARKMDAGTDVVAEAKAYVEAHPGFDDFGVYEPVELPYDLREHEYEPYKGQLDPPEEDELEEDDWGDYAPRSRFDRNRNDDEPRGRDDRRSYDGDYDGRSYDDDEDYEGGSSRGWNDYDDEFHYDDSDGALDGYGSLSKDTRDNALDNNDYDEDYQPFFSRRDED